jgi:hypothetical protein
MQNAKFPPPPNISGKLSGNLNLTRLSREYCMIIEDQAWYDLAPPPSPPLLSRRYKLDRRHTGRLRKSYNLMGGGGGGGALSGTDPLRYRRTVTFLRLVVTILPMEKYLSLLPPGWLGMSLTLTVRLVLFCNRNKLDTTTVPPLPPHTHPLLEKGKAV